MQQKCIVGTAWKRDPGALMRSDSVHRESPCFDLAFEAPQAQNKRNDVRSQTRASPNGWIRRPPGGSTACEWTSFLHLIWRVQMFSVLKPKLWTLSLWTQSRIWDVFHVENRSFKTCRMRIPHLYFPLQVMGSVSVVEMFWILTQIFGFTDASLIPFLWETSHLHPDGTEWDQDPQTSAVFLHTHGTPRLKTCTVL